MYTLLLLIEGRQVTISAYEDKHTNDIMTSQRQEAFALIPSKYLSKLSDIMKILCDNGFSISNCGMYELSRQQSIDFATKLNFGLSEDWSAGPLIALTLTGNDPFHRLKVLVAGNFLKHIEPMKVFHSFIFMFK